MTRERPETGVLIAGVGGILLLVSLFLGWYVLPGFTITAWTAFEVWDLVLAALAIGVIVAAATKLGWWRGPGHAIGLEVLGLVALVIVASQLIDRPPSALHSDIGDGGWLGLVAAFLIVAGGLMAEARVTVSFNPAAGPAGGLGAGGRARRGAGWRRPRGPAVDGGVPPAAGVPVDVPPGGVTPVGGPLGGGPGVGAAGPGRLGVRPGDEDETVAAPPPPRRPRI